MEGYLARDKDGVIYLFSHRPIKKPEFGIWMSDRIEGFILDEDKLPVGCFPKWEDEDPVKLNITIKVSK